MNPTAEATERGPVAAFYVRDGERFVPTDYARGPWDAGLQHGGPPAALLARALRDEALSARTLGPATEEDDPGFLARITVDLLRPIPMAPLSLRAETVRKGRRGHWLTAFVECAGKQVATASGIWLPHVPLTIEDPPSPEAPAPKPPREGTPFRFGFFPDGPTKKYSDAIESRLVSGEWGKGPVTVWLRSSVTLIDGERLLPTEQTLVLADATNGVAPSLDIDRYTFINPDLTVHLHRAPRGGWLAISGRGVAHEAGAGLVQGTLYDRHGEVGRALQSLVLSPRS